MAPVDTPIGDSSSNLEKCTKSILQGDPKQHSTIMHHQNQEHSVTSTAIAKLKEDEKKIQGVRNMYMVEGNISRNIS